MSWFDLFTFEKLYLLKKGPIFVGSYAIQNKLIQKSICWHQLFMQKWALSRLSTTVLHKCGHTTEGDPNKPPLAACENDACKKKYGRKGGKLWCLKCQEAKEQKKEVDKKVWANKNYQKLKVFYSQKSLSDYSLYPIFLQFFL